MRYLVTGLVASLLGGGLWGCGGARPVAPRVPVVAVQPHPSPPRPARPPLPLLAPPAHEPGPRPARAGAPLVFPVSRAAVPTRGLVGQHIAVWPSHGLYHNAARRRWMWQRARLFTTVEDLLPFAVVQPYLAPMLERAGAVVLMPRERDVQNAESVADNDGGPAATGRYAETGAWRPAGAGFAHRPPYRDGDAPFALGTAREATTTAVPTAEAVWTFAVPAEGDYAVHVAWAGGPSRADDARYAIEHTGGTSHVMVNQRMGGGTWVYLGTYRLAPGVGRVVLTNASATPGRTVSADAARIGGGVGLVARGGAPSGRPRWTEASRYYQQWAGAPPHVYNVTGERDDYKDDYQSRGEWVNWLRASPAGGDGYGPEGHRNAPGLGIPVRLALALHTDAGQTSDSSTVGTLVIHDTRGLDGTGAFPDSTSRVATAALAERVLDTIVGDLRALYDPAWTRRGRRNRAYSEASRPNVPSVLVEWLAHQNYEDARFALDPRVRFAVARSLYKAIGRSLAGPASFVVQPLAPDGLAATFASNGSVRLTWDPVFDPLEPTAAPDGYTVYRRVLPGGWDEGVRVTETAVGLPAPAPGSVAAYRVAAVNAGGESAPSETVAVGRPLAASPLAEAAPVLVVAAWDRVAPPAAVETLGPDGERRLGFDRSLDPGVADGYDLLTTGDQTEFDRRRPWRTDDDPGHGASRGDREGTLGRGNTHDAAVVQGEALLAAGYAFVSASDEAVEREHVSLTDYAAVSLALGLEKRTPWPRADDTRPWAFEALPASLRGPLDRFLDSGGRLFVSGAFWASDAAATPTGAAWLVRRLGVEAGPPQAVNTLTAPAGGAPDMGLLPDGATVAVSDQATRSAFAVVRPDALVPATADASVVLRFAGSGDAAAVATPRSVALGVPLEALPDTDTRARVLRAAFRRLLASPAGL